MNKTSTTAGAVLLLLAGAAAGWLGHSVLGRPDESEEASEHLPPDEMDVEVTTARAESGDFVGAESVIGVVRPDEGAVVSLGSRAGGRVVEVFVRTGDDVPAGTRILRFDDAPLVLAAAQAQAALAAATTQVEAFDRADRGRQESEFVAAAEKAAADEEAAVRHLDRQTALLAEGLVAARAVEEARTAVQKTKADRTSADAALASFRGASAELQRSALAASRDAAAAALADAKALLAAAVVVAPVDGRVLSLSAHAGDRVDAGATVGSLLRPTGRVLVFGMTPASAAGIAPGAVVAWFDTGGARRTAKVRTVAADIGGATGLVEVVAVPDGPPPPPGLVLRGEIEARPILGAVLVPTRAVVRDEDRPTVVVIDAQRVAKRTAVEVLGRRDGTAAVRGEVKAGDQVAVEGAYNLPDGVRTHEAPAHGSEGHEASPTPKGPSK